MASNMSNKRAREELDLELDEIETSNKLQALIKHCYHVMNVEPDRDDEINYHERMYALHCMQHPTSDEIELIRTADTRESSPIDETYCPCCGNFCEHFYGGRCITCATSDSQPGETDDKA